jgi:hypothetical protein
MDRPIVIVSVAGKELIPRRWGDDQIVGSVQRTLWGAGIRCDERTVNEPGDLAPYRGTDTVVFPNFRCFHDPHGYLASILDGWGIMYIGSDRTGHENESKIRMKRRLCRRGVPTPDFRVIRGDGDLFRLDTMAIPFMIKPDCGTESLGVRRVDHRADARSTAAELAHRFGWPLLAEAWSRAREFAGDGHDAGGDRRPVPWRHRLRWRHRRRYARRSGRGRAGSGRRFRDHLADDVLGDREGRGGSRRRRVAHVHHPAVQ